MKIGLSSSSDIHYVGPDPVHWINGQDLIRSMREDENEEDDNDNDVAPNSPPLIYRNLSCFSDKRSFDPRPLSFQRASCQQL